MTDDHEPFVKTEVTLLKCSRCNHTWQPKYKDRLPKTCPVCKSANWDKPKSYRKPFTWKNQETKNLNRRRKSQSV